MNQLSKMSASDIFCAAVKGRNFITPTVVRYEKVSDSMVVELSHGEYINRQQMWGITVVSADAQVDGHIEYTRRDDLDNLCWSSADAENHIAQLKKRDYSLI